MNNEDTENKKRAAKNKITITHDGKKIDALVKANKQSNKELKRELMTALNYNGINAYNEIILKQSAAIGLKGLITTSNVLDCDIFDIVQDEYKNFVPKVKFESFSSEKKLDEYVHQQEVIYKGRIVLFRSFPSTIYNGNNEERYFHLRATSNIEIYSLMAIIEFGYSQFSSFSKEDKLQKLDKILDNHDSLHNTVVVMNDDMFSRWSADCEILGDELLLIIAPLYKHAVFVIKSSEVVKAIKSKITKTRLQSENRSLKLLEILRDGIRKNYSLVDFTFTLKKNKSYFYEDTLNLLRPDLREEVINKVAKWESSFVVEKD